MSEVPKNAAPTLIPSNPGKAVAGKVDLSNPQKTWTEHFNLVTLMASVLGELGHQVESGESWLVHPNSGFVLLPRLVQLVASDKGGVRTTTTLQTNHPALMPNGVFEYQHSIGESLEESLRKGFDQWAQTHFVALLDALDPAPTTCATLGMGFPEKDGKPAYNRRAILGPVAHLAQNPRAEADMNAAGNGARGEQDEQDEHHAFCPCCLLTNSFDTFMEFIEDRGVYCLFLFAARDAKGAPQADCRVNGNDWERGAEALRQYVTTWPDAGFEFRKQYVVLHTVENES